MAQRIAVLTGDIIASQRIKDQARLFRILDDGLAELETRYASQGERYRGDGFQVALPSASHALGAAILLRAALIMHSDDTQRWDARIAVAIGQDRWDANTRVTQASGPVFVRSGQALDALSDGQEHLGLAIVDGHDDGCPALMTRFVDDLIESWSRYSAEIVYLRLLHAESQSALGERLGIRQPSVHKRLRTARWPLIEAYLEHMQERFTAKEPS